jgi:hypothetical protein
VFVVAIRNRFRNPYSRTAPLPALFKSEMPSPQGPVSENGRDRRAMRRFTMRLPASVRVPCIPCPFLTHTENISARGVFFYIDRLMSEGTRLEVTMDFPPQVTLADPVRVRLRALVVRVNEESPTRVGVAAKIEGCEFLQPGESDAGGSGQLRSVAGG